jgi:hypothetical protein
MRLALRSWEKASGIRASMDHLVKKRWVKMHVSVDTKTQQIVAAEITKG